MSISPYLFFNGNCAEAMTFYQETFGGKLDLLRFANMPPEAQSPGANPDHVMHAHLALPHGGSLLASDDPTPNYKGMSGVMVSLTFPTVEDATNKFNAIAEGGQVSLPIGKTFWSEAFGMVTDRFGASWMISVDQPQEA